MKQLNVLIEALPVIRVEGAHQVDIKDIEMDSRTVTEGALFVAVRGTQADGHRYIAQAIRQGAVAVVCEEIPADLPQELKEAATFVVVENSEVLTGQLATRFYGDPTQRMKLVGVTGTNGKTTIATLLYRMFRAFGHRTGLISTVCNYIDDEAVPTEHTTPDPITLNRRSV